MHSPGVVFAHGVFCVFLGPDNSGNITKKENMQSFIDSVWKESKDKGLHLVLGDGGYDASRHPPRCYWAFLWNLLSCSSLLFVRFSVVGDENRQEYLSRQLILCQIIVALATLRKGGIFCCKLFGKSHV